jgi:hypothetical protein
LQGAAIKKLHFPARVRDDAPFLQTACDIRDIGAAHTEHLGQKLLFQHELIAFRAIGGVEQPPALLHRVKRIASRRDPCLIEQYVNIPEAQLCHGSATRNQLPKILCRDCQGVDRQLGNDANARCMGPKSCTGPGHAFPTDDAGFNRPAALERDQERKHARQREEDRRDVTPLLLNDLALVKRDEG